MCNIDSNDKIYTQKIDKVEHCQSQSQSSKLNNKERFVQMMMFNVVDLLMIMIENTNKWCQQMWMWMNRLNSWHMECWNCFFLVSLLVDVGILFRK